MSGTIHISTETWKISLPNDWSELPASSEEMVYFEAPDKTKGVYLSTWNIDNSKRSLNEELQHFLDVELRSFNTMKGYSWKVLDEWTSTELAVMISCANCLDAEHNYRIVCYLMGSLPWLVQASFHDYDCVDYNASVNFFEPIIASLHIHSEQE